MNNEESGDLDPEAGLTEAVRTAIEQRAAALATDLKVRMPQMIEDHRQIHRGFEERLYARWKPALDLFEAVRVGAFEAGEMFHQEFGNTIPSDSKVVYDVLVRQHARACLTTSEIKHLLCGGYAAAALARWRTLHEIAVVSYLVQQHGNDLAERYMLHETIDNAKAAVQYQTYCNRMGQKPLDQQVVTTLQVQRKKLLSRFGRSFDNTYGWAATIAGKDAPTFADLERLVVLDHVRPYYKWSSHRIHATATGIQLSRMRTGSVMLAGPSNGYLADPACLTLGALLQCTTYLLMMQPQVQSFIMIHALRRLTHEAYTVFVEIHHKLMADEFDDENVL